MFCNLTQQFWSLTYVGRWCESHYKMSEKRKWCSQMDSNHFAFRIISTRSPNRQKVRSWIRKAFTAVCVNSIFLIAFQLLFLKPTIGTFSVTLSFSSLVICVTDECVQTSDITLVHFITASDPWSYNKATLHSMHRVKEDRIIFLLRFSHQFLIHQLVPLSQLQICRLPWWNHWICV